MSDDLISRQAAIDTNGLDEEIRCEMCRNQMKTDRGCDGNCKYNEKLYEKIMQILNERIKPLPSAQLEQKTGRWEHDGGNFANRWICSQCGYKFYFEKSEAKYCPNCGAKMESDNNDS